ncbi:MAG TPA: hypothetical protein VFZ34_24360 [Blastocatellia bacterium]|nr:hypothetical protein [Blastocatellia bacterium]
MRIIRYLVFYTILGFLSLSVKAQQESVQPSLSTSIATPAPTPIPTPTPTVAPAAAPLKIGRVTVSGSLRVRAENWDWFETDNADQAYTFGAATLRVALGQNLEKVEWLVEGQAPVFIGLPTNAIAPAPQGQLGLGGTYFAASGQQDASLILKQAFVRFKGKSNSLKVGRLEFNDGTEMVPTDAALATIKRDHIAQRLIGTFGFTHVGRSFDGLHYVHSFKSGNFTFVGFRPTEGVFQLNGNRQMDVDVFYAAFTKSLKRKMIEGEFRLFALQYHDGRGVVKTDNRTAALRNRDRANLRITTLGGHFITVRNAGKAKFDFLTWGVGQAGMWGVLAHRAGAIAVESGVQFKAKGAPWLRGGYFRSTGDGDATDSQHTTFFEVLPTPRIYARMPYFNAMNKEDVFVQLRLKPHKLLVLRTDAHHLRLSNANDLWYGGGGAFQPTTFGYNGRPSNGQRGLGWLYDVSADWMVKPQTTITAYLGVARGNNVQAAIYPLGGARPTAHFAYLELTQRF